MRVQETEQLLCRFLLKFSLYLSPDAVRSTARRFDGLKLDYGRAFDAEVLESARCAPCLGPHIHAAEVFLALLQLVSSYIESAYCCTQLAQVAWSSTFVYRARRCLSGSDPTHAFHSVLRLCSGKSLRVSRCFYKDLLEDEGVLELLPCCCCSQDSIWYGPLPVASVHMLSLIMQRSPRRKLAAH